MPKIVDEQMREATRRRIMRQAASEFARLGFDQANINVIAEQAGIGKGTIYLYFENKRDLFLEMLRFIAQAQLAVIRAALAPEGTLRQRLERLFRAFAHLAEEESDNFNVYMSALYGVNRAFQAEATKLLRDYVAVIALMLEGDRLDAGTEPGTGRGPHSACRGHRLDGTVADGILYPLRQSARSIRARNRPASRKRCSAYLAWHRGSIGWLCSFFRLFFE